MKLNEEEDPPRMKSRPHSEVHLLLLFLLLPPSFFPAGLAMVDERDDLPPTWREGERR
jgi:hypothetical protein